MSRTPKRSVTYEQLEACLSALLAKIDNLTTEEFSRGAERPEREAARALLEQSRRQPLKRARKAKPAPLLGAM